MKFRFRDHDLLYGVLVAALIGFVFGTALDGARPHDFAGMQAAATATAAAPTSPAPLASATPSAVSAR